MAHVLALEADLVLSSPESTFSVGLIWCRLLSVDLVVAVRIDWLSQSRQNYSGRPPAAPIASFTDGLKVWIFT